MWWIPIISRYCIMSNHVGYDRFNQSDLIVSDVLLRSKPGESGKRIYKRNAIKHWITSKRIRSSSWTGFHSHPTGFDPPYSTWVTFKVSKLDIFLFVNIKLINISGYSFDFPSTVCNACCLL